jgi:hypothetical protein
MRTRPGPWMTVTLGLVAAACATKPAPRVQPKIEPAPLPPSRVEKMREPLEVTPLELQFSGLRGAAKTSDSVAIKNDSSEPVQVSDIRVIGEQAETFKLAELPLLPLLLPPASSVSFSVVFQPRADAKPGVHHARVRIVRTEDDDGPPCDLTGLVAKGKAAADEPTLQQILEALGYDVDVGSTTLVVPVDKVGDEILAPTFVRAKPGNVGFYLIARYTSDEDSTFGTYSLVGRKPVMKPIGSAERGHNQTLNPELEGESQTSFDPGTSTFGLFLKVGKRTLYSDDALNTGARKHVAKVFPLRSRGHAPVQDAYVVAFDEDGNGDYQDHVFMMWNVKPGSERIE